MGWKENRRRKRTWYRHYRRLAEDLKRLMSHGTFTPESVLQMVFALYESRRMHGKRFIARSAYESLRLACQDTGLNKMSLIAHDHPLGRPQMFGELQPPPGVRTPELPGEGSQWESLPGGRRRQHVTPQPENPPEPQPVEPVGPSMRTMSLHHKWTGQRNAQAPRC